MDRIPVIDLFAGPGGLAEGFSSVIRGKNRFFDVRLSVEMDESAHKTLELRSFCRQFPYGKLPKEYYNILRETDLTKREEKKKTLFEKYSQQYETARKEAWLAELGGEEFPPELVDKRIKEALNSQNIFPRRYFYPSLDTLAYIEPLQYCPISRDISIRILCLPIYPDLEKKKQLEIIEIIKGSI